jgi:hypothetical protein
MIRERRGKNAPHPNPLPEYRERGPDRLGPNAIALKRGGVRWLFP